MFRTMMSTNNSSLGLDAGAQRWYSMPDMPESTSENVESSTSPQRYLLGDENRTNLMSYMPTYVIDWRWALEILDSLSPSETLPLKPSPASETASDGADQCTNGEA